MAPVSMTGVLLGRGNVDRERHVHREDSGKCQGQRGRLRTGPPLQAWAECVLLMHPEFQPAELWGDASVAEDPHVVVLSSHSPRKPTQHPELAKCPNSCKLSAHVSI